MLANVKKLFNNSPSSMGPTVPDGYRVYAVGDVHGRLDLLDDCLAQIEGEIAALGPARNIIVFLGDLIDRGPASSGVIERLRNYAPRRARLVFLSGNHEEVLLRLLRGESQYLLDWLRFGGAQCAESYGVDPAQLKRMGPNEAVSLLAESIPRSHQAFLESFVDTFSIGSYLFVHAGIRPGIPLAEQSQTDLRWIREPFLGSAEEHGKVVVHGHTICEAVECRPNRIGIDTGAYRTGVLTVLGLEGSEQWLLQSKVPGLPDAETSVVGSP